MRSLPAFTLFRRGKPRRLRGLELADEIGKPCSEKASNRDGTLYHPRFCRASQIKILIMRRLQKPRLLKAAGLQSRRDTPDGAHPDSTAGAPVSDPARPPRIPTRRVGDRRSTAWSAW